MLSSRSVIRFNWLCIVHKQRTRYENIRVGFRSRVLIHRLVTKRSCDVRCCASYVFGNGDVEKELDSREVVQKVSEEDFREGETTEEESQRVLEWGDVCRQV